jgi:hypothetical protein
MLDGGEGFRASRHDARDDGTDATDESTRGSEPDSGANVGWFRDPLKHHEHRFRDERGWTRRILHFGVPGDDPYWPPPAWYRDPSRRFRYRYWDEDGWTALASLGGRVTGDPVDAPWPPPMPVGGLEDVEGLKERATGWSRRQSAPAAVPPYITRALVVPTGVGRLLWPWGRL